MLLTPQDLLAAGHRLRDYSDLMLELSGFSGGRIPRFLRPKQIKQIREAAGLAPRTETSAERAWQHYQEIADAITRQLAHINRAIERALKRSEKRVQAAEEALERIRERATIRQQGQAGLSHGGPPRGFTDDGQELTREEVESIQCRPDARHGSNARRPENATGWPSSSENNPPGEASGAWTGGRI